MSEGQRYNDNLENLGRTLHVQNMANKNGYGGET